MSKTFVKMTKLYSHIRSNHKLALSRAFFTLAYSRLNSGQSSDHTELKITKMVKILESAQRKLMEKR